MRLHLLINTARFAEAKLLFFWVPEDIIVMDPFEMDIGFHDVNTLSAGIKHAIVVEPSGEYIFSLEQVNQIWYFAMTWHDCMVYDAGELGPNSFRLEDGRTWNASKLVSVPEQCQIGRNQQSPSALPTEEDPDPCGADDSQLPLQATTPTRSPPLSSSCQPPNCPSVVTSRGPSTRDRRLPSRFRDFYV
ncbi:hypothetical protein HPB49_009796 [Dermacentor silvarum]|uniref:Uncharacterized protein n=1 Tax=Dermacentor silvarum TaxID=543639 RepID=A0ACB8DI73_DERSI|nr:hypothetical protein HPB49_009796 [Dermacentor silvarum]